MKNKFPLIFYTILLILFLSSEIVAQNSHEEVIYTSQITEQIITPVRIAFDKLNNLYVTESSQNSILKYDNAGNFAEKIFLEFSPVAITADDDGNIFISDKNSGVIYKRNSFGDITQFYVGCKFPAYMEFGVDGLLYVVDSKLKHIIALDKFSNLVKTIGSGTLIYPSCLAYDSRNERILVGEHGGIGGSFSPTCKVWIFDLDGNLTGSFGSNGNGDGEFYRIQGLAVGKCGNIYVCEPYQGNVSVFDENGVFKTKFGVFGSGDGELNVPLDIAFDIQERILIPSSNNGTINFYTVSDDFPTSNIVNSNATICTGETTDLTINFTGTAPWNFTYTIDGLNPTTVTTSNNPHTLTVSEAGIYETTALSDANFSGTCFSGSATITIHNELPTSSIITPDATICEGEIAEIDVNLTGLSPWTFVYTINGSNPKTITTPNNLYPIEATKSGLYEIIILDGGACSGTEFTGSSTITVNPLPTSVFELGNDRVFICEGETTNLLLNLTGSAPWNFTYMIDGKDTTTINDLSQETYNLTTSKLGTYEIIEISDNLCNTGFYSGYPEVVFLERPTATLENIFSNICHGESTTIPVYFTGEAPWSLTYTNNNATTTMSNIYSNPNVLTVTQEGTYEAISISDANCTGTGLYGSPTVTVFPVASPSFTFISNDLEVTFLNNSTDADLYLWDFGNGSSSTEINPSHVYATPGTYQVQLTASNTLCGGNIIVQEVEINQVTIENIADNNKINIYPNPSNGLITIKINNKSEDKVNIEVLNISGQIILSKKFKNSKTIKQLNLANYSNGIYIIKVIMGNIVQTKRLILNKQAAKKHS